MDAFYASIEQRDDPSLRGRPVAVGRPPSDRGVVAAASYEARKFGVHSAMSSAVALRLCPALALVRPDFAKYRGVSAQVFEIFRDVTPLVEPLSLDEAYLDVTENAWGRSAGHDGREADQGRRFTSATGLTASAGVAPNKFLAKIASGWKKPDGLTVIAPGRVEAFLHELPVDALFGVGPVTREAAARDRRHQDHRTPRRSSAACWNGRSAAPRSGCAARARHRRTARRAGPAREVVGNRKHLPAGLVDPDRIREEIAAMAREAAGWLERHELLRANGHHQGAVLGLHDGHAQPLVAPGHS